MSETTVLTPEQRRELKAQKRLKQREISVLRAEKMHKARLLAQPRPDVSPATAPALNVGCSGWFYWHLKGSFYPSQMPTKDWFGHYSDHFDTVELNAPFYSWPTVATVLSWRRQAQGRPMLYTVKAPELITHIHNFEKTDTLVNDFGYVADLLGPMMGCFLFQLPPSYQYSAERLDNILRQLDPARRNVVAFRHVSWWNDHVYGAFENAGAIFCSCSGPRLPDPVIKTAPDMYVRFHGTERWYRHDYTDEEPHAWAAKIHSAHAERVWIYFNNDFDGYAIKNARALRAMLQTAKTGDADP